MTADDRTVRIVFEGVLDIHRAESVESALPKPDDVDRVVIDCTAVRSIESTVITVFLRYRRAFIEAGRDPLNIVFIASEPVRRIFDVAGVTKVMTVISPPSPK